MPIIFLGRGFPSSNSVHFNVTVFSIYFMNIRYYNMLLLGKRVIYLWEGNPLICTCSVPHGVWVLLSFPYYKLLTSLFGMFPRTLNYVHVSCEFIFLNLQETPTNPSWIKKSKENIECSVAFLKTQYKTLLLITKNENLHLLRDFPKRRPGGNSTLFQLKWTYLSNLLEMIFESLWELKSFEFVVQEM